MPERFTTPVGRLVQGDAFVAQTKDQNGALRVVKQGPNAGQPNPKFYLGVAFAKTDPAFETQVRQVLEREARMAWPQFFPVPGGPIVNPSFAWKIIDGDGFDKFGKPNSAKEGFAGHWIVRFESSFAPKVFHVGRYSPADQVTNPAELPRGYYVRINASTKSNENPQNPGLYVNVDLIEIAGFGPVIVSGPDAAGAFAAPAALPPGASAIPTGQVTHTTPPAAAPLPPAAPVALLPPVPPAAAPVTHVMLPAANGATYEALIAQGWTDALLVQHGMMQAPAPAAPPAAPAAPPYNGYMNAPPAAPAAPAPAPAAPPPAAPPPPVVARQMTAAAGANTYDSYVAAGWNDDQLRAQGLMV